MNRIASAPASKAVKPSWSLQHHYRLQIAIRHLFFRDPQILIHCCKHVP